MIKLTLVDRYPHKQEPTGFVWINPIQLGYITVGPVFIHVDPSPAVKPERQPVTWVHFVADGENDPAFAVAESPEEILQQIWHHNEDQLDHAAQHAATRSNFS